MKPVSLARPPLLAIAVFAGIFIPSFTLGVFAIEGWNLPTWLAVTLPVVLFGSVRGTLLLLGYKAVHWSVPKLKSWRSKGHHH